MEKLEKALKELELLKEKIREWNDETNDSMKTTQQILNAFAKLYDTGFDELLSQVEGAESFIQDAIKEQEEVEEELEQAQRRIDELEAAANE